MHSNNRCHIAHGFNGVVLGAAISLSTGRHEIMADGLCVGCGFCGTKETSSKADRTQVGYNLCMFTVTGHHVVAMKIDRMRFFFAVVATAPIITNSILKIDNIVKWRTKINSHRRPLHER